MPWLCRRAWTSACSFHESDARRVHVLHAQVRRRRDADAVDEQGHVVVVGDLRGFHGWQAAVIAAVGDQKQPGDGLIARFAQDLAERPPDGGGGFVGPEALEKARGPRAGQLGTGLRLQLPGEGRVPPEAVERQVRFPGEARPQVQPRVGRQLAQQIPAREGADLRGDVRRDGNARGRVGEPHGKRRPPEIVGRIAPVGQRHALRTVEQHQQGLPDRLVDRQVDHRLDQQRQEHGEASRAQEDQRKTPSARQAGRRARVGPHHPGQQQEKQEEGPARRETDVAETPLLLAGRECTGVPGKKLEETISHVLLFTSTG